VLSVLRPRRFTPRERIALAARCEGKWCTALKQIDAEDRMHND
jgi:hypothetical protein